MALRHDKFPTHGMIHTIVLAELSHQLLAAHAELGLQAARRVVDTSYAIVSSCITLLHPRALLTMYDLAVARTGLHADLRVLFQQQHLQAAPGGGARDAQPHDAGAGHHERLLRHFAL